MGAVYNKVIRAICSANITSQNNSGDLNRTVMLDHYRDDSAVIRECRQSSQYRYTVPNLVQYRAVLFYCIVQYSSGTPSVCIGRRLYCYSSKICCEQRCECRVLRSRQLAPMRARRRTLKYSDASAVSRPF